MTRPFSRVVPEAHWTTHFLGRWFRQRGIHLRPFAREHDIARSTLMQWWKAKTSPQFRELEYVLDCLGLELMIVPKGTRAGPGAMFHDEKVAPGRNAAILPTCG